MKMRRHELRNSLWLLHVASHQADQDAAPLRCPAANPQWDDCGLLHGCASEQHVCHRAYEPAFVNGLICTDGGYTCGNEAGG